MHRMATQRAERIAVGSAGFITALVAAALPLAAQEVIELPGEDRLLDADFEEIYRLGAVGGRG